LVKWLVVATNHLYQIALFFAMGGAFYMIITKPTIQAPAKYLRFAYALCKANFKSDKFWLIYDQNQPLHDDIQD
jgi:hypothetical protein